MEAATEAATETTEVTSDSQSTEVAGSQTTEQAGGDQSTGEGATTTSWPDNWRETYAGEDEKKLGRLQRYTKPEAALDALFSAQDKISSGEIKAGYNAEGSDEEKALWRSENGMPESVDKYNLNLPEGTVMGDADKAMVDSFSEVAFEANMSNAQMAKAYEWQQKQGEVQQAAREVSDDNLMRETEDKLRQDWGGDYRRNMNMVHGLLAQAPEGIKANFLDGRMADGNPIGSDPQMLEWLATLSRQINPVTTLIPGNVENVASALEDEIDTIEKLMRTDRKAYNADEKQQQRYRELLDARSKHPK